jgi:hypothetical protein
VIFDALCFAPLVVVAVVVAVARLSARDVVRRQRRRRWTRS